MAEIRYFTEAGRTRWAEWVEELRGNPSLALPDGLLTNSDLTRRAPAVHGIERKLITSKYELAEHLAPAVLAIRDARMSADRWPGLWDWLAGFFFDALCPANSSGERDLRESARYVFSLDYKRRYRHRVFGPVDLYIRLGKYSRLLIHGAPTSLTDWEEQTASRYQISSNRGIAEAMHELYWDYQKEAPKRGAAPNRRDPGTLRRFSDVMQQLDRTFDLGSVDAKNILELLPREFLKFQRR